MRLSFLRFVATSLVILVVSISSVSAYSISNSDLKVDDLQVNNFKSVNPFEDFINQKSLGKNSSFQSDEYIQYLLNHGHKITVIDTYYKRNNETGKREEVGKVVTENAIPIKPLNLTNSLEYTYDERLRQTILFTGETVADKSWSSLAPIIIDSIYVAIAWKYPALGLVTAIGDNIYPDLPEIHWGATKETNINSYITYQDFYEIYDSWISDSYHCYVYTECRITNLTTVVTITNTYTHSTKSGTKDYDGIRRQYSERFNLHSSNWELARLNKLYSWCDIFEYYSGNCIENPGILP